LEQRLTGQGKTFEIPEKVPFRLTHNMVEAMGVNGVEGMSPFQAYCPHEDGTYLFIRDADDQVYSEKQRKSVYKSSERIPNP
jgi:phosphatidylinositol kinase/protein kinase (PI-3  family)